VDDNGDGLNVESGVQVDSGGTPGVITDDSEIFWLDNLESEIAGVGGACGTADRDDVVRMNRISNW